MAQDLAATGVELPALMAAGRWKHSKMPARYTERQAAGRGAVARYYQESEYEPQSKEREFAITGKEEIIARLPKTRDRNLQPDASQLGESKIGGKVHPGVRQQ